MAKAKIIEVEENWVALDAKTAGFRFVRGFVAVLVAGLAAQYGDSQYFLLLAPALNALSKFVRNQYDLDLRII